MDQSVTDAVGEQFETHSLPGILAKAAKDGLELGKDNGEICFRIIHSEWYKYTLDAVKKGWIDAP